MSKVTAFFVIGLALLVEGYFQIVRDLLPVDFIETDSNVDVYQKVVSNEGAYTGDMIFYILGIVFIAMAIILKRKG